jgi:hypothetical protein
MSFQLTSQQKLDLTAYINAYRTIHQAPPLVWDATIATFTNSWATNMAFNHNFQHSGRATYGENIAYFQGYQADPIGLIKKAVDLWYSEVSMYDFSNPGFSASTGHFTCLVWKASTSYAIAIAFDANSNMAYVSMNTYPPGNVLGQFQQNVFPLVTGAPTPTPSTMPPPVVPIPSLPPASTSGMISVNKTTIIQQLEYINHLLLMGTSKYGVIKAINAIIYNLMNMTTSSA